METIKEYCSQETVDLSELVDKFPDIGEYVDDLTFQEVSRFINIPICFKLNKIAEINQTHKIVLFKGTVIRAGIAKSMCKVISYKCKQCQHITEVQSDSSNYFINENILKCQNTVVKQQKFNPFFKSNYQKFRRQKCNSSQFEKLDNQKLMDYQEIKVQDTYTVLQPGTVSNSIRVMLEGNLVNSCNSGEDVIIGGVVTQRWKMYKQKPQITLWIDCKYLKKQNLIKQHIQINDITTNQYKQRNDIIQSFIPELCNLWQIKLGILLSLIGGVTKTKNGITNRGDSHLLLIGEPGTGKTTLLLQACKVSEKSIYVNGIGTSQAGLTLTFVKEGSDWMIEAGALIMADQGLCCIDEFNLLPLQSQQSILEALEQQTISSSKAGISAKLNARATIIAACNPVEQIYNSKLSVQCNTGLSTPLLSRFDQIHVLKDQHDLDLDRQLCDHLLNFNSCKLNYTATQIKEYIQHIKEQYKPTMNDDCSSVIQKYYTYVRQQNPQVTARKFESLIRLSEAHARLCSKHIIDEFDVVTVIALIESTQFTGLYPEFLDVLNEHTTINDIQKMWRNIQ